MIFEEIESISTVAATQSASELTSIRLDRDHLPLLLRVHCEQAQPHKVWCAGDNYAELARMLAMEHPRKQWATLRSARERRIPHFTLAVDLDGTGTALPCNGKLIFQLSGLVLLPQPRRAIELKLEGSRGLSLKAAAVGRSALARAGGFNYPTQEP